MSEGGKSDETKETTQRERQKAISGKVPGCLWEWSMVEKSTGESEEEKTPTEEMLYICRQLTQEGLGSDTQTHTHAPTYNHNNNRAHTPTHSQKHTRALHFGKISWLKPFFLV